MIPVGDSGLKHHDGRIDEEWLPELKGRKGAEVYREMGDNDAVVSSILFAMTTSLRSADWYVTPHTDSGQDPTDDDIAAAQLVETAMHDMTGLTWGDFIADALEKIRYGWSYFEIVWKVRDGVDSNYNDGLLGWHSFQSRSQDTLLRWEYDEANTLQGMVQQNRAGGVLIPIERSLHFRTSSRKQSPEGISLLRGAYTSWYRRKRIQAFEAIGIERDLAGIPSFGVPSELFTAAAGTPQAQALDAYRKIATSLRRDEQASIVYPLAYDENGNPKTKIELLSAPSGRAQDTDGVITRYGREIAMTTLQDVILLGHEHAGSLALADTKKRLARAALQAQINEIVETINHRAVRQLFEFNGFALDRLPRIESGELEERSLDTFAVMLAAMGSVGMTIDDLEGQNEVRSIMGLPPLTDVVDGPIETTTL